MTTHFAPQTDLQFTRFKGISHTRCGESHKMPFAQWVQHRTAAAVTYWPSAAELSDELEQYRRGVAEAEEIGGAYRDDLLAENEELWAKSVKAAKLTDVEAKALTVEVGAILTDGRRADAAVTGITWLFIDIDGIERDRLSALVKFNYSLAQNMFLVKQFTSNLI
jgi:two-component SAPR family response regulator